MNGVRQCPLPSSTPPPGSTNPLSVPPKPSWPPSSPPQNGASLEESPKTTTAALFFRKDRQRPPPGASSSTKSDEDTGNSSFQSSRDSIESGRTSTQPSSPVAGPSSPRMPMPMRVTELSRKSADGEKRTSMVYSAKDDLLMSLLASEAIVDSRGFDILSAEEVEDLKKEYQVLSSRLVALKKKLTLETKIRDAASSLSKANSTYKSVSKQTSEQLENANRKVDLAQKELWRISEKAGEINRKLLEHRAGVLSYSVRSMEKNMAPPDAVNGNGDLNVSGYTTPNRLSTMSPTQSSVNSAHSSSSRSKFDGAHFFAGHSDAIVPAVSKGPASSAEVATLQEQLKEAQTALEAASAQQQKMLKELTAIRAEKQVIQTSNSSELRQAEEMIAALERQMGEMQSQVDLAAKLQDEKKTWTKERIELEEKRREVDKLERRLEALEERSGEMSEVESALARERRKLDDKDREIAELKAERATLLAERIVLQAGGESKAQLEQGVDALQDIMKKHGVSHYSRDATVRGLATSIGKHLDEMKVKLGAQTNVQEEWNAVRAKLEDDVRVGLDKREMLGEELEQARKERDAAKADIRILENQLREIQESGNGPIVQYTGDAQKVTAVLEPIWAVLPSPEARAQKLGKPKGVNGLSAPSPTTASPVAKGGASLSEMDVRSLKTLYDPNAFPLSARPSGPDNFTVESFAARVQALIADDRALIERLIRFAQAHDLLKKNAERAQKLAQESNAALETYQKQVKMLEDRNVSMVAKQTAMQDEVQSLQEAVARITTEKLDLENQASEQAEMCRQLTDANNSLSARVLKLAEESNSVSSSDVSRKKLEAEVKKYETEVKRLEAEVKRLETALSECQSALARATEEVDEVRMSQQTQQMALLEELNSVQTENTNLRAQLRKK
ncbi:Up-regulated during septation-domain-containing protein [Daedaleopsis nitida]|nr:Up-regulated during septation-domain-containing protein [Daedaleopsis nitida]